MASLTKGDLTNKVAAKTGVTQATANAVITAALETIRESLMIGDEVRLMHFGTFSVQFSAARIGTNPKTKEKVHIPAKHRARFSASKELTAALPKIQEVSP
jgi:DNA-binding protein HU-beta